MQAHEYLREQNERQLALLPEHIRDALSRLNDRDPVYLAEYLESNFEQLKGATDQLSEVKPQLSEDQKHLARVFNIPEEDFIDILIKSGTLEVNSQDTDIEAADTNDSGLTEDEQAAAALMGLSTEEMMKAKGLSNE